MCFATFIDLEKKTCFLFLNHTAGNLLMSCVSLSLLLACTLSALKLSVISRDGLLRVSKTAPFRCLEKNKNKNKTIHYYILGIIGFRYYTHVDVDINVAYWYNHKEDS